MKPKVIKSLFVCVISMLFASFCLTFAWFASTIRQTAGGFGIEASNIVGDLYYYEGNHSGPDFWGYKDNENIQSKPKLYSTNNDGLFAKYDSASSLDPFNMKELLPGTRHLFMMELQSNYSEPMAIHFKLKNWLSETLNGSERYAPNGDTINLTEAIYIYTIDTPIVKTGDGTANITDILNWANSPTLVNKFNSNAKNNDGKQPYTISTYNNCASRTTYLIPFIFEFTNDPATYYTRDDNGKYVKPSGAQTGTSSVYAGMKFTIKQFIVTQFIEERD